MAGLEMLDPTRAANVVSKDRWIDLLDLGTRVWKHGMEKRRTDALEGTLFTFDEVLEIMVDHGAMTQGVKEKIKGVVETSQLQLLEEAAGFVSNGQYGIETVYAAFEREFHRVEGRMAIVSLNMYARLS